MKKTLLDLSFQRFALGRTVVFLAALLFVATSCREGSALGIELQPEGEFDPVNMIDTLTVRGFTMEGEAQRSDEAQSMLGRVQSNVFGASESALIMNFKFQSQGIFPDDPFGYTVDSVVLHFTPGQIYGEFTDPVPIEAYEITERIYADSAYLSDFQPALEESPLGTYTMQLDEPLTAKDFVVVDGDTVPFQFRMPLDNKLGAYLLAGLDNQYSTISEFKDYFNGIMLRVSDQMNPGISGAIYLFSLTDEESGLSVYASKPGADPVKVFYPITISETRINQFTHSYAGSTVETYLNNPSEDEDVLFVQGMAGTRAEIQIPYLVDFAQKANVAINKATLSFSLSDMQPDALGNGEQLFLLDLEEDDVESLTLDYIYSQIRSGGAYDQTTNSYEFDITRHVQKVIDEARIGNDVNYGLRLHAQVPVINGNDTSQNVVKGSDNIVLKLYHTDLND